MRRKIYKRFVMCITTGKVLEEDSFWYDGDVCECKGQSGSTTTVDYEYNKRMAAIAEQQQGQATELFNLFKYGVIYDPNEEVTDPNAKKVLNPEWTKWDNQKRTASMSADNDPYGTFGSSLASIGKEPEKYISDPEAKTTKGALEGYDSNTISELKLMQEQLASEYKLLPLQTEAERKLIPLRAETEEAGLGLQKAMITDAQKSLKERSPVISKFYEEALSGVDVEKRVSEARAGVMQDFGQSMDIARRDMSRMGIDPTSGRGTAVFKNIGVERATRMAGASTAAENLAEQEKFERLRLGVGTNIQYQ